jgi:hypothetical protein
MESHDKWNHTRLSLEWAFEFVIVRGLIEEQIQRFVELYAQPITECITASPAARSGVTFPQFPQRTEKPSLAPRTTPGTSRAALLSLNDFL